MFYKVKDLVSRCCEIKAFGHAQVGDDPKLVSLSQADFIRQIMSPKGRQTLFGEDLPLDDPRIDAMAEKWIEAITIRERPFFIGGTTSELGAIAARKCLDKAGVLPCEVDAVIGATNTGPEYPSLADELVELLGCTKARAYDVQEACTSGSVAIEAAHSAIISGKHKAVLVVCSERASVLAPYDDCYRSNLFGDSSFAVLLVASDKESFVFFDFYCEPFEGNVDRIRKTDQGFTQDGPKVHAFVQKRVVPLLVQGVEAAGISSANIAHLVVHQPSGRTLDGLFRKLTRAWPDFDERNFHRVVETMGNTSSASTGWIISSEIEKGNIKPGQLVVVSTFGAGLSVGNFAFYA